MDDCVVLSRDDAARRPADLTSYIETYYESIPEGLVPRDRRLFAWCLEASRHLRLNTVPEERVEDLYEVNVLAILLNVMVDDLADQVLVHRGSEEEILESALRVLRGESAVVIPQNFKAYFSLLDGLRGHLCERLSAWPGFRSWRPQLVRFLGRWADAMRSSVDWNRQVLGLEPVRAHEGFDDFVVAMAPPIHTFIYGLFNLMHLGPTALAEREPILEVLRCGERFQVMSNWLATWEVEVMSQDYSSGVVCWALEHRVVRWEDLQKEPAHRIVERLRHSDFALFFERAMARLAEDLLHQGRGIRSFEAGAYLEGLRYVHQLHLNHREMLKH